MNTFMTPEYFRESIEASFRERIKKLEAENSALSMSVADLKKAYEDVKKVDVHLSDVIGILNDEESVMIVIGDEEDEDYTLHTVLAVKRFFSDTMLNAKVNLVSVEPKESMIVIYIDDPFEEGEEDGR